jgi:hypothetical protein
VLLYSGHCHDQHCRTHILKSASTRLRYRTHDESRYRRADFGQQTYPRGGERTDWNDLERQNMPGDHVLAPYDAEERESGDQSSSGLCWSDLCRNGDPLPGSLVPVRYIEYEYTSIGRQLIFEKKSFLKLLGRTDAEYPVRRCDESSHHQRRFQPYLGRGHACCWITDVPTIVITLIEKDSSHRNIQSRNLRHCRSHPQQSILFLGPIQRRVGVLVRPRELNSAHRRQFALRLALLPKDLPDPEFDSLKRLQ